MRPRRSVLYMPGANERALEKAKGLPADALVLDLEDAVAPDAKVDGSATGVRSRRRRGPTANERSPSASTASAPNGTTTTYAPWHRRDRTRSSCRK